MWLVGALSVTSVLSGLTDVVLDNVLGVFIEFTSLVVAVLVDALIYIFHNGMLRPLITELYGNFVLTKDMFSATEIMGILLNYCYAKMRVIAICMMVLITSWQLFKTFFAHFVQTEVEDGLKIAVKLMIFTTLAWSAKDICIKFVNVGAEVITGFINMAIKTGIGKGVSNGEIIKDNITNMFDIMENLNFSMFSTGGDLGGVFDIVKFMFILKIDKELLKLGVDMAEKYVMLVFMIVISPIAFACGVVKSASTFLSKWISLFSSTILYNILQIMVMSFLFFATSFMTVQTTSSSWGGLVPATYMLKDGYTFKYISIMYAILALGSNAVYLIDELGFSFLGESTNQIESFAKVATKAAAFVGTAAGKKLLGKKPKTNYGEEDDKGDEEPETNYGEGDEEPETNYGDYDEDDYDEEPETNYGDSYYEVYY